MASEKSAAKAPGYRQPALADLSGIDTKAFLQRLADEGKIDVSEVNAMLAQMRAATQKKALIAATPEQKESLLRISSGYEDAVKVAQMLDEKSRLKVPSLEEIANAVQKLPPELLAEINKFNRPTLLITPANSMAEKARALDAHKLYPGQNDSYWDKKRNSDLWMPKPTKLSIAITDGEPSMPQLSRALLSKDWEDCYRAIYEDYEERNMRMITAHEYAALAQRGLLEYTKAKADPKHPSHQNPEKEIMDFTFETVTAFYHSKSVLTNLKNTPHGYFFAIIRRLNFYGFYPGDSVDRLRSRPVVEVLL